MFTWPCTLSVIKNNWCVIVRENTLIVEILSETKGEINYQELLLGRKSTFALQSYLRLSVLTACCLANNKNWVFISKLFSLCDILFISQSHFSTGKTKSLIMSKPDGSARINRWRHRNHHPNLLPSFFNFLQLRLAIMPFNPSNKVE